MFQFIFVFWPVVVFPIAFMFSKDDNVTILQKAGSGLVTGLIGAFILFFIFKFLKKALGMISSGWRD
jgi:uncharacterized membrane protein YeaQ/YmgE (transglycosylase-associated protein family)